MELRWCAEHGIPHSQLLDWEAEDRAKLHAHLLEESLRCVMCGTMTWEWDPEQGGSKRAYTAIESFCPGCYAKHGLSEGNDQPAGTTIQLVPHSDALIEQQRRAYERQLAEKAEERRGRGRNLRSTASG
jgi:hypothetical protein